MNVDLSGKAVVVTGSTSGIGEGIARRMAALGAGVVVNSVSSVDAGKQLADELPDAVYVQGDISDAATAENLVAAARERWGRLDGVVNNAGITAPVRIPEIDQLTVEHWQRVLSTNIVGTFLLSQAALPLLTESGDGWITNITSAAGNRYLGSSLPYAVSKAGIHHMTKILARHVGPAVRVNCVAPGLTQTPMIAPYPEFAEGVKAQAPLARIGQPDDVADACIGLIAMKYATGQVVVVDGGVTLVV